MDYDCLGVFRVIGWTPEGSIGEIGEIKMNQTNTKYWLNRLKRVYTKKGFRVEVEIVHRPMDGWGIH